MDGDKAKSTKRAYQAAWRSGLIGLAGRVGCHHTSTTRMMPSPTRTSCWGTWAIWVGLERQPHRSSGCLCNQGRAQASWPWRHYGKMHRLWIVLNSLEKTSPKKPRRLGVTVPMLKWIGEHLEGGCSSFGELRVDCRMLKAALLTAWFYMLRAKEFSDSSGVDPDMIVRGADVSLTVEGQVADKGGRVEEMTLQFCKTKADQSAFGTCKTMLRTEVEHVCVVQAMVELKEVAPRRFEGPEALMPLFRWSSGGVLKRMEIQNILQKAARAVGLPAERFQSHSLRIGGASALFQATGEV